jgi:hypothetical protein
VEKTGLHTSSIVIDRYSNFGNTCTYLSKEFARVLGPGQIVTCVNRSSEKPLKDLTIENLRSGKYAGTAVIVLYKLPTKT